MASRLMRQLRCVHTPSVSTSSRVPLAYDVYGPGQQRVSTGEQHTADLSSQPPIIFLHGFLGSKRENRSVSKLLARDLSRQVYVMDLRNHGDAGHHPTHSYMEMALDVESFMKSHGLRNAALIGHSMGAKVALTLGLHAPDIVSAVVAVDNCPVHNVPLPEDFPRYLRGLECVEQAKIRTHAEGERILAEFEESPTVRLFLLSNFVKCADLPYLKLRLPLGTLKTAIGPLSDFPYRDESVKFNNPALFIRANQSYYVPESAFPAISALFPCSTVSTVNSGHWIVQERPEEFRQLVVNFLQSTA